MQPADYTWPQGPVDKLVVRMIRWQRLPALGALMKLLLKWRGTDFPWQTLTGSDPILQHGASAVAVHLRVRMGSRVVVMHGVTIGRADPWRRRRDDSAIGVTVEDDVFLGANAVVLFSDDRPVTLAEGTVVGANSVLTESTGPWQVWAGNPARRIGTREH